MPLGMKALGRKGEAWFWEEFGNRMTNVLDNERNSVTSLFDVIKHEKRPSTPYRAKKGQAGATGPSLQPSMLQQEVGPRLEQV